MKRRTMKSLFADLMLVCMLLANLAVSANAAAITSPEIIPQYTAIYDLEADLNINDDGCATCYSFVNAKSGYTVTIKMQLKRDGVTIKTWNASGDSTMELEKDYYVTDVSGDHDYQVIVTATVKNSAGTIIESPSAKSVVISYKN